MRLYAGILVALFLGAGYVLGTAAAQILARLLETGGTT